MSKPKAPAKKAKTKAKKPVRPRPMTVYAVQRRINGYEGPADGEPERIFADKKAAEQYATERTHACRVFLNPFADELAGNSITGGEKKLVAVVKKLGLKPPQKKKSDYYTDWHGWWDQMYHDMSDAQRDAIWDSLNKLKLYQVVETMLE